MIFHAILSAFFSIVLVENVDSMCPAIGNLGIFNFSAEWLMENTDKNEKYILRLCQPPGMKLYFGIADYSNPNLLTGYGEGNLYVLYCTYFIIIDKYENYIEQCICIYLLMILCV